MGIRFCVLLCLSWLFSLSLSIVAQAKPAAYLRVSGGKYYIAVKADPPIENGGDLKKVLASVYQKGKQVSTEVAKPDQFGSDFTLTLNNGVILQGKSPDLMVAVHSYPATGGGTAGFSVNVNLELEIQILAENARCENAFTITVKPVSAPPSDYVKDRLGFVFNYLKTARPAVEVESFVKADKETREARPISYAGDPEALETCYICLTLQAPPPTGKYDIQFTYPADAPVEAQAPLMGEGFMRARFQSAPFKIDKREADGGSFERNLDLAVQWTSSVTEKTEMGVFKRERDNQGVLDLRLVPWLNIRPLPDAERGLLYYLTPLTIDARVSTGKIDSKTLSTNQIVVGSEFEMRHINKGDQTNPTLQRITLSFKNASDRDFKLAEWKGGARFEPVFSFFNNPLSAQVKHPDFKLVPKRGKKEIINMKGIGWQVFPFVGFEAGRTWRNRNPEIADETEGFVRRLYFGATINLDLTAFLRLAAIETFFFRGEVKENRWRHHFVASAESPLPPFSVNTSQSLFLSFERGELPPFATPAVNALKVGYRIQWDGWLGQRR